MRTFRPHGLILLYHRIATPLWDPWHNCVWPERFEQQLEFLSREAAVVPLAQLPERLRRRSGGRPVVSITFDDGYADNLHAALPLLEKYETPATMFIATSWIGKGQPFWWDQLSGLVSAMDRVPPCIRLPVGTDEFVWRCGAGETEEQAMRGRFHQALWSRLLLSTDHDRRGAFEHLRSYINREPEDDSETRPMTQQELRQLAASPLVEIGAHTMSHCSLPDLPLAAQLTEIAGSREQCHALLGEYPMSFAYPFGRFVDSTPELVTAAGFERACSSQHELVWAGCGVNVLPRLQVLNYSRRTFGLRFAWQWLP